MIEFKGLYHTRTDKSPKAVLVQFDGVLLHVWHMADPFYRLLTSDVFRIPASLNSTRKWIKLPNGAKIETDNTKALISLQTKYRATIDRVKPKMISKVLIFAFFTICAAILFGLSVALSIP